MISVYKHLTNNNMTERDVDSISRYVALIQWGRANPVGFIEDVLGVPLMDYQKWLISMTWAAEYAVWVCSRNAGKSFLLGNFLTARALLFPKQRIHIMSSVSRQANETFETMENIVKRNVPSLKTVNTVFFDELEKSNSNTDGFTHNPKTGNKCALLNGSGIWSVVGTEKTVRGKRSTCNAYDEAGSINKAYFDVTEPFMAQSASFVMADKSVNTKTLPKGIPNLRLYIGSASDTGSEFYNRYREGFKQMLSGNPKYFVADIDCEIPMHPTQNGKPFPPLLEKEEIDRKMRENEILANREYHNIFDRFSLEDALVSRSDIREFTEEVMPQIRCKEPGTPYVLCYDPASKSDNSPVLVGEAFKDEEGRWCGRVVNMINLVTTYADGSHKPMRLEDQVDVLRGMIFEYNGREKANPYDNIKLLLEGGIGGQAPGIAQELVKDWKDKAGMTHPGIIDAENEYMKRWGENFPHAVKDRMLLLEPRAYRNAYFEALKEQVASGRIKFPPQAPKYDTLVVDEADGKAVEHKLDKVEMSALIQMDLMKEEAVSIVRSKTAAGNITYGLPPEKRNKMHDDRVFVLAMFCWWIKQLQIDDTLGEPPAVDYQRAYLDKAAKPAARASSEDDSGWGRLLVGARGSANRKKASPFGALTNPFAKK